MFFEPTIFNNHYNSENAGKQLNKFKLLKLKYVNFNRIKAYFL